MLYTGLSLNGAMFAGIVEQLDTHLTNLGTVGFMNVFNQAVAQAQGSAKISRVTLLVPPYIVDIPTQAEQVNPGATAAVLAMIAVSIICCIVLAARAPQSTRVVYPTYKDPELNFLRDKCVKKVALAEERIYREKRKAEHATLTLTLALAVTLTPSLTLSLNPDPNPHAYWKAEHAALLQMEEFDGGVPSMGAPSPQGRPPDAAPSSEGTISI